MQCGETEDDQDYSCFFPPQCTASHDPDVISLCKEGLTRLLIFNLSAPPPEDLAPL